LTLRELASCLTAMIDPAAILFDETLDAVLIADDDRYYVDANAAAYALFGCPPGALIGRRVDDFVLLPEGSKVEEMWRAFRGEGSADGVIRIRRCDGGERTVHFRAKAAVRPGRHLSILRDLTELLRTTAAAEQARAEAERAAERTTQLQALTERMSDAFTPRAILEAALDGCRRLLGVTGGWIGLREAGRGGGVVVAFEHAGAGDARCPLPELALAEDDAPRSVTPTLLVVPLVARHAPQGALLLHRSDGGALDDEEQAFVGTLGRLGGQALERAQLLQQTERARAEAEQARSDAERASRHKDEFLAMLGHELRNPLAPMLTALQLMNLRGAGELQRERAIIERQLRHMMRLVDDLLDVSRITRGQIELKRQRVEMAPLVAEAIETASPLLEDKAHHVALDVSPDLWVDGDRARLLQVFSNLITNAAKYTDAGGHVTVTGERHNGQIVIEVCDTGIGIAADMQPHVFELFVQGARGHDRAEGGLGIGLSLVRSLTELHGGSVTLASVAGGGSQFTVRLPAATAPTAEAPAPAAASPPGAQRRVLVVDDNADAAELVAMALTSAGHEVRVAHDGPAALEVARAFTFDVALLDLGLPAMDGIELGERLRASGQPGKLVAVTGYGQEADRERSREAGFCAHLVKPVELAAIMNAVESCTRSR
jgi:PAS domain S-box-containing protein